MSSPRTRSVFGRNDRHGRVHVVDTHVSKSYRQKALIAFATTTFVVGLLAAVVISADLHPILGLILGLLLGAVCGAIVGALVAIWPLLRVLVHWWVELVLATGVLAGWMTLMQAAPTVVAVLVLAVGVGVPAAIGRTRRLALAWWWCLVVRHRLRLYFAGHSGAHTARLSGSRPLVLWARPTPAGERVWVWLRPGLSLKDLEAEGQLARLAVTCWAGEARAAAASRSYAGLLRLDITRRDPLTGTVISPLPILIPDTPPGTTTVAGMSPIGLDLPDVPEEADTPTPPRRTRRGDADREQTPDWVDTNYDYA